MSVLYLWEHNSIIQILSYFSSPQILSMASSHRALCPYPANNKKFWNRMKVSQQLVFLNSVI